MYIYIYALTMPPLALARHHKLQQLAATTRCNNSLQQLAATRCNTLQEHTAASSALPCVRGVHSSCSVRRQAPLIQCLA